jgi:uncharacterized repeat protein (TIGR01451 family)
MTFSSLRAFICLLCIISSLNIKSQIIDYGEGLPSPNSLRTDYPISVIPSIPNPDIPQSLLCRDLKVIFVLDESGSIALSGATPAVKEGVRALANALLYSGATLNIIEFSTIASIIDLGINTVNDTFITRLNGYLGSGFNGLNYNPIGATNWHDALIRVTNIQADLVVFFTDGYPTAYIGSDGNPVVQGGSATFPSALDSAIVQANIIKGQGKHMFVVGVGPGIDLPNIQAISGTDLFGGQANVLTADYTTPPYEELAANLAGAVNTICGTELSIVKSVSQAGVCAGDEVIFTSVLTNTGGTFNFDANNVVLRDRYPSGYSNIVILSPSSGVSLNGNNEIEYQVGLLAPGQSVSLVVKATVDAPPDDFESMAIGTAFNANTVKDSITVVSGYATSEIDTSTCYRLQINGVIYDSSGIYYQTLQSAAGCDSVITINYTRITSVASFIACSAAGISCIDSCNARASVTVSGNIADYGFIWNTMPPKFSNNIVGLCPGDYKVIVLDSISGCADSCSVNIPNLPCDNFRTFTQGGYGANPKGKNVASYLKSNFSKAFPLGLQIGCNNKLSLTSWQSVVDFLPSGSTPSILPSGNLINPGQRYQNVLAGQLVTAVLNIGLDSAISSFASNSILLKDLIIANGVFNGWTVRQLINEANKAIGGCPSLYSLSNLNYALDRFNNNYNYNEYINSPLVNNCFLSCPINPNTTLSRPLQQESIVYGENDLYEELTIFPNPAGSKINYNISSDLGEGIVLLTDISGKVLQKHSFKFGPNYLDIQNYSSGSYLLILKTRKGIQTKKVIIE